MTYGESSSWRWKRPPKKKPLFDDLNDPCLHGEKTKMSIYDFHSKFVSGDERNILFAALRRLSLLDNPRELIALAEGDPGWPVWDGAGSPQTLGLSPASA
jgi:hypothetical protein